MATFNVTPQAVGSYFNKIECFCFTETRIEAGGQLDHAGRVLCRSGIDTRKRNSARLRTITLSYTFYESDEEPQEFSSTKERTDAS